MYEMFRSALKYAKLRVTTINSINVNATLGYLSYLD